jgi:hypothetical protein
MSDISKNDAVAFANSILQLQKRLDEVEAANRVLETMRVSVDRAVEKIRAAVDELRNSTNAPGRSDENDHLECKEETTK